MKIMKYNKLLLIALLMAQYAMPTQAAVYGTLKQDLYFEMEDKQVTKPAGTAVSIYDADEEAYLIRIDDSTSEYLDKSFIELAGILTRATTDTVVLEKKDVSSKVLLEIEKDSLVIALDKEDNFYKVKIDGIVGYIDGSTLDESELEELIHKLTTGEEVVEYAKQFLGGRYVYGGTNLATGVDCSGFTQQVMKNFGINLSRTSSAQYANNGRKVSVSDIKPGDLVYYGRGRVTHAAIYAGNGKVIHATTPRTGITMGNLYHGLPLIGVKRVIE